MGNTLEPLITDLLNNDLYFLGDGTLRHKPSQKFYQNYAEIIVLYNIPTHLVTNVYNLLDLFYEDDRDSIQIKELL